MMPRDGSYTRKQIQSEEFVSILSRASEIISTIGYPNVAEMVSTMAGRNVATSRDLTEIREDKATILVVKLPYRIASPNSKGTHNSRNPADYEFFSVEYSRAN